MRPLFVVATSWFALSACGFRPGLDSDPASWAPPLALAGPDAAPSGANDASVDPACDGEPAFAADLRESMPGAVSHRADQPCLQGCHEAGGTARMVFAVGGTIHRSATSRLVVTSGSVHGVGGTTLSIDACGNIYAIAGALTTDPQFTEPFVQSPTLHRMDKSLYRVADAGSCNQSGCHDFASTLRWGVYF